jgi:hypothetical protein
MGIVDGLRANSANTNARLMSRIQDTNTIGRIDLENALSESGPNVINAQKNINSLNAFTGRPQNSDQDATPIWNSNIIGTTLDNLKQRIEAIDSQFSDLTGYVVDASVVERGLVNLTSQSFAGEKEFSDGIITKIKTFLDSAISYGFFLDDTTTGTDQTLVAPEAPIIKLTDTNLVSLQGIEAVSDFRLLYVLNQTGNDLDIKNEQGTIENQFLTLTDDDIVLKDKGFLAVVYNPDIEKWVVLSCFGETLSLAVVGNSPNPNAATLLNGILNLEPANSTNPGVVTAIAQTFGGNKTFQNNVTVNSVLNCSGTVQYSYGVRTNIGDDVVLAIPDKVILGLTDPALNSLAGIEPIGSPNNHDILYLLNETNEVIILKHQSTAAQPTERFICPDLQDVELEPNKFAFLFYDRDQTRWRVVSQFGTGGGNTSSFVGAFTGDTIDATKDTIQIWRYTGSSAQVLDSIDVTEIVDGASIEITGTDNTNTITLNPNDVSEGWIINGSWTGYKFSKLVLRWDESFDRFVEVSRNGI